MAVLYAFAGFNHLVNPEFYVAIIPPQLPAPDWLNLASGLAEIVLGVFLLEPLVHARGRRALSSDLARGDWRPWLALWVGGLVCGFFWELWNWRSYPKWIYHIPFVGFGKVFEMPILGYLGYLPFALELYLMCQLAFRKPPLLRL